MGVSEVCRRLGMSRQNYYARRQQRQRRQVDGELVAELVRRERAVQLRAKASVPPQGQPIFQRVIPPIATPHQQT